MRAIQSLFVIIIIATVAIVIGIAFISWIWSTIQSSWRSELLRIIEAKIVKRDNDYYLYLDMRNDGEKDAEIYKIEIYQMETINTDIKIPPGSTTTQEIKLTKEYAGQTSYRARLYLKTGTLYFIDIQLPVE